jgi:outer membrane protein TolC
MRRATLKALDGALPAAETSTTAAREALVALEVRAKGGLAREVEVEASRALVTKAEVEESMLRVRLAGTKTRLAWMGG